MSSAESGLTSLFWLSTCTHRICSNKHLPRVNTRARLSTHNTSTSFSPYMCYFSDIIKERVEIGIGADYLE